MPLGPPDGDLALVVFTRDADGDLTREDIMGVRFVPFTGHEV